MLSYKGFFNLEVQRLYPISTPKNGHSALPKPSVTRLIEARGARLIFLPPCSPDLNHGKFHNDKGQYDRAIQDFDPAIRLDPKDANAFLNRGIAPRGADEQDLDMKDHDQAIKLNPGNSVAFMAQDYLSIYRVLSSARPALEVIPSPLEDAFVLCAAE